MKAFIKFFAVFSLISLAISSSFFIFNNKTEDDFPKYPQTFSLPECVTLTDPDSKISSEIPLDKYLTGCVLAQIPCTFEEETLKVQAVICRTCLAHEIAENGEISDVLPLQDYFDEEKAKEYYGENFTTAYEKANKAVLRTEGVIITYQNFPITTAFHPVSCGFTESAEDIFNEKIPYLLSVESPQDSSLDGFEQVVEISKTKIFSRLCAYFNIESGENFNLKIKNTTSHNTALTLEFSYDGTKKEITGAEFAQIFGLNSCNLNISISEDYYTITCRGAGHLVGLSQYGANVLAQQGENFESIIKYYFCGVSLTVLQ